MPIFISYSHQDRKFVDKLALSLVKKKARLWIDRWELNVGDSIIDKIQEAIQKAVALILVLSPSSINSEWCKKEFSAGLLRELEEKRVVVLPLLLEKCEIPIFLRGKKYADFRNDYDEGLETILEAIAAVTSEDQGRIRNKTGYFVDWSIDWGFTEEGLFRLRLTFVDHGQEFPYIVLTEINLFANDVATEIYKKRIADGKEWLGRLTAIYALGEIAEQNTNFHFNLDNSMPKSHKITWQDDKLGAVYEINISSRWIGENTGKSVFVDYGNNLIMVKRELEKNIVKFI